MSTWFLFYVFMDGTERKEMDFVRELSDVINGHDSAWSYFSYSRIHRHGHADWPAGFKIVDAKTGETVFSFFDKLSLFRH